VILNVECTIKFSSEERAGSREASVDKRTACKRDYEECQMAKLVVVLLFTWLDITATILGSNLLLDGRGRGRHYLTE